jgi:hypothetical protein
MADKEYASSNVGNQNPIFFPYPVILIISYIPSRHVTNHKLINGPTQVMPLY